MFNTQHKFMRRPIQDDGYTSICTRCFATVGSDRTQENLDVLEEKHVCDKETLRRLATQSRTGYPGGR